MEENHRPWDRRMGARSSHVTVDVPKLREQLASHLPRLRRFARALARNPVEADDLVQSAIVRALTRADQLRAQPRPLTWLLGLVTRAWTDETPARRRQQRAFNIGPPGAELGETQREQVLLADALSRLPEEQHLAVTLVCVESFSYREAAESASVPVATLTVRLARARESLHRLLGATEVPAASPALAEDVLMACVDEQLEAHQRVEVDAAMQDDPGLARQIAQHRAQAARLRQAFSAVLEEPVPERLLRIARSAPTLQRRNSNIIPLRRRPPPPPRWSWTHLSTLGATLLAGVVVGEMLPHGSLAALTRGGAGGLLAGGTLARALSSQPGGHPGAAEQPVLIGASFHTRAGDYCRTFALRPAGPAMAGATGLACRGAEGWRVRLLAENEPQLAGINLPAGISPGLTEQLGPPLDARAETAARARGWLP